MIDNLADIIPWYQLWYHRLSCWVAQRHPLWRSLQICLKYDARLRFWGPRPLGHAHFPAKKGPENRNRKLIAMPLISNQHSIDTSSRSSYKKFQLNWPINGWVMVKNRLPIHGIIGIFRDFLAYNLAKN